MQGRFQWFGHYLRVGWLGSIEIRVHWAAMLVTVGLVAFGHPGLWLGLASLVLVHELGHAFFVRRASLAVSHIALHGLGGRCVYLGEWGTPWNHAVIAWGGVLFQAALLIPAIAAATLLPAQESWLGLQLESLLAVWVRLNLALIVLNLIPVAPLDGATAWRLVPMLPARLRAARRASSQRREDSERAASTRRRVAHNRAKARGLRAVDRD